MTIKEVAQKAVDEWYAYQNAYELEVGLHMIQEREPKVIVEIGVAFGATLAAWAEVCKPDLVIGIDPLTLPMTPIQKDVLDGLVKKYDLKIIPHRSEHSEAFEKLEELLDGRKIDFLFIDGEHLYDNVKHDFDEYMKYMNHISTIGFHDVYYNKTLYDAGSRVNVLWHQLKRSYINYDEIHFHSSMGLGFIHLPKDAS